MSLLLCYVTLRVSPQPARETTVEHALAVEHLTDLA